MARAGLPALFRDVDALLFDLDGVVTKTATLHAQAWARLFDEFLARRAPGDEPATAPFDPVEDYRAHVDGRTREDGVRGFLASRGIVLPEGRPDDGPDRETVHGLARRKNAYFRELLLTRGVESFRSTVDLVQAARGAGLRLAVVSSSRNAGAVLAAAGLADAFDLLVDGTDLARAGLPGKPAPDLYLEAARRLGTSPERAAVFEDAQAGVAAARAGGFALVVGIDRSSRSEALREAGAHVVVADLAQLGEPHRSLGREPVRLDRLPSPIASPGALDELLQGKWPALFLDYDGTLSPIADRPEDARLPERARVVLAALARLCPVAIVSGRARPDVEAMVGLDGIVYAGCHGFDISGAGLEPPRLPEAERAVPVLAALAAGLRARLGRVEGVRVEEKGYAVAVHTRLVAPALEDDVRAAVAGQVSRHPGVRLAGGKRVLEVLPRVDWDKGRAVRWLLAALGLEGKGVVPIYMGDDVTDEDAFRALAGIGVGIVVGSDDGIEPRLTRAGYAVAGTREALQFLEALRARLAEEAR